MCSRPADEQLGAQLPPTCCSGSAAAAVVMSDSRGGSRGHNRGRARRSASGRWTSHVSRAATATCGRQYQRQGRVRDPPDETTAVGPQPQTADTQSAHRSQGHILQAQAQGLGHSRAQVAGVQQGVRRGQQEGQAGTQQFPLQGGGQGSGRAVGRLLTQVKPRSSVGAEHSSRTRQGQARTAPTPTPRLLPTPTTPRPPLPLAW